MTFVGLLLLLLIAFKLAGIIAWSWWAVLAPALFVLVIYILFLGMAAIFASLLRWRR